MAGGWDFAGPPVRLGGGIVTLVEGSSFCLSDRAGDILRTSRRACSSVTRASCPAGSCASTTIASNH